MSVRTIWMAWIPFLLVLLIVILVVINLSPQPPECPKCPECPECSQGLPEPNGPEGTPPCGNCNLTLDPPSSPTTRKLSLEHIIDMSYCRTAPPWKLVSVKVHTDDGTTYFYAPSDSNAVITDLLGPHEFSLKPPVTIDGSSVPDPTIAEIMKVEVNMEVSTGNSAGKTEDRSCLTVNNGGTGASCSVPCGGS